jgi:oligo-1,6-glucosidase
MSKKFLSLLLVFLFSFFAISSFSAAEIVKEKQFDQTPARKWWKEAVVYQIYPRSFKDSNGDGIGDLRGIIEKLDYVKSLGVDVIWLNPIFESPNDDNGYDISDYRAIMKEFGTMQDFDLLLKEMHKRKLKLVLDLVANHSSDEHFWFQEARKSRTNPYRNYYHWWDAEKGKPPFRRSFFDVNNDAWKYDEKTNSYYLHYYSVKQPDLNWENPKVRQEMYDVMHFWFKKGIDGFRMDVIPFISKDTMFPVIPEDKRGQLDTRAFYADGPHLHEYLQEMNREVLSKYDVMSVGEGSGVNINQVSKFIAPERKELNMLYHFEGRNIPYTSAKMPFPEPNFDLLKFKQVYSDWDKVFAENGWGTIYLGNHDVPRMVSRWGNDAPEYRDLSSKMLTTFLLTMNSTPYYLAGDELGMTNIRFENISDYRDIKTINRYKEIKEKNGDVQAFMDDQKMISRDNARTPFQWNSNTNAGFTNGTPWIKVNPNYTQVNVEAEEKQKDSVLSYFKTLIKLRKSSDVLIFGKYTLLDQNNPKVYAYTRELNGKKMLILLNFTAQEADYKVDLDLSRAKKVLGNYSTPFAAKLKSYEAVILELP